MTENVIDSVFKVILQNPAFNTIMSREAKSLRNDVLCLCLKHAGTGDDFTVFVDRMVKQYSPIPWERAILYTDSRSAHNAVLRRTIKKFLDGHLL